MQWRKLLSNAIVKVVTERANNRQLNQTPLPRYRERMISVFLNAQIRYKNNSFISQYFLNQFHSRSSLMSKWDEQFDFEDFDAKPKKAKEAKKPNNRNDQFFDLDDQPPAKAPKLPTINHKTTQSHNNSAEKDRNPKNSKKVYDQYEEIYEDVEEPKVLTQKDNKKQKESSYAYEEIEDIQQIKPEKQSAKNLNNQPKNTEHSDQEQYYQEIEEIPQPPKGSRKVIQDNKPKVDPPPHKKQEKQSQNYQQNFDYYEQDFSEQIEPQKKVEVPKKSVTTVNLKPKDKSLKDQNKTEEQKLSANANKAPTYKQLKVAPPPLPKQPQKENKDNSAVSKKLIQQKAGAHGLSQPPKQMAKSDSRKSLKSSGSRSNIGYSRVSKVSKNNVSTFTPNKHMNLVQKSFPEQDEKLNSLPIDRISRMNQQVRDMIRKFNQELNQLINKNMVLLKQKPSEKQKTIDDKIRMLEEQLRSGATALEVIENDHDRLKGRTGELRQEQYQLIMEKRIEECKDQARQTLKIITKLKFEMNNDGNKLSRQDIEKKMAQELHQIKVMLIQLKKEEEKNQARFAKLGTMFEELDGKNNDKDYELSEQIDSAKEKGIVFGIKQETRRKHQELKLKMATADNHRKCMQGLYKNKCDIIVHQNQQIKITIKSIQSQINNLAHSIQHEQEESVKLIKKAKENSRISQTFAQNLDKLLKAIEESQANHLYEIRTEGNKSQASERPLKTSMYQNISKQKPTRNSASKKQPTLPKSQPRPNPDQINLMKPNFMKKKQKTSDVQALQKQDQKKNKAYEQVWEEEDQKAKKEQERKKEEQRARQQQRRKEDQRIKDQQAKKEEARKAAEQDKKKPFNLKKNRMNQQKSIQQSPQSRPEEVHVPAKLQIPLSVGENAQKKQEDKPTIGPRMMRFNRKQRNTNEISKNQIEVPKEEIKAAKQQPLKLAVQPLPKPAQPDQPVFMPKRFNMRNRLEKKDQSYVPTIQNRAQEQKEDKKEEKRQEKREEKREERREYNPPNFSLKNDEATKNTFEGKKIQNDKNLQPRQEQKPKFTLRLRDRQKKENSQGAYVPTRLTEVAAEKDQKNQININIAGQQPKKEEKPGFTSNFKNDSQGYQPSFKAPIKQAEKESNFYKQTESKEAQIANKDSFSNPYAQKPAAEPVEKQANIAPVNNPYAPKQDMPKRERQGPVKKIKVQNKDPKPKFNIYEQAEDITQPVIQPAVSPAAQVPVAKQANLTNLAKTNELDLNAMLGIKKKEKSNDLDDLLGEIKIEKKKDRKKNNDFFNDLEL